MAYLVALTTMAAAEVAVATLGRADDVQEAA